MNATAEREVILIPAVKTEETAAIPRQLSVTAYCRVSTDEDEQMSSLENQTEYYTDKIASNPAWRFAGIYADPGISGLSAKKRPEFQRMIRHCKQNKIDVILCKNISRFARNTVDLLHYVRLLKAIGVAVIFEKEGVDTSKLTNEMALTLLGCFAQSESESISANVTWGKRKSYKDGKVSYNYTNWLGYEKGGDGKPRVVEAEAVIVRRIFDRFLAGHSIARIKQDLESDGIPPKKGGTAWSPAVISRILANERMAGDALLQKTFVSDVLNKKTKKNNGELPMYLVKGCHTAVITRETYDAAQAELARRSARRKRSDKTATELSKYSSLYALTDILVCGDCGTPYKRVTWARGGQKKIVWRCVNRLDYGTKYCKNSPTVEETALHTAILQAINEIILDRSVTQMILANLKTVISGGSDVDVFAAECRIKALQDEMMRLVRQNSESEIPDFNVRLEVIAGEMKQHKDAIREHEESQRRSAESSAQIGRIESALNALTAELTDWSEDIVRHFVRTVRVESKDKILIEFHGGIVVEKIM